MNYESKNIIISRVIFSREKEIDLVVGESPPRGPIRDLQDGQKRMSLSWMFGDRSDENFYSTGPKSRRVLDPIL